jgi:hypothetical protein
MGSFTTYYTLEVEQTIHQDVPQATATTAASSPHHFNEVSGAKSDIDALKSAIYSQIRRSRV